MPDMPAYFERIGATRFRATSAVGGAWDPDEQHVAPPMGLIAHAIEQDHASRRSDRFHLARVSFDILGTLPIDAVEIDVRVLRGGRTIELVEATLSHDQRPAIIARAWLMQTTDTTEIAGSALPRIPSREEFEPFAAREGWLGEFVTTVEVHRHQHEPGRGWVWVRPGIPLLEHEAISPTARLLGVVDIANGMTPRARPDEVFFPNLDLTAHLFREPRGEWIGFDTTVSFGERGIGLTDVVLHDDEGAIGTVQQILTVRPRAAG